MALLSQPNSEPAPEKRKSPLASILPFTSIGVIIAILYVAWTFYSRSQSAKEAQQAAAEKAEEARKQSAGRIFGDGAVKFLVFSASDGHLKRGQSTRLCYGVVNAVKVSITPAVGEDVKPTSRHCVDITPKETTTYKFTASNQAGQEDSTSLTVHVE